MKFLRTVAILLPTLLVPTSGECQIRFKHHFVDGSGPPGDVFAPLVLADFDGDGHVDIATSRASFGGGPNAAYWYRNLGAIDRWSPAKVLRAEFTAGCGSVAFDVDGDGRTDYVAGEWLRNVAGGDGPKFVPGGWSLGRQIHDLELGDFDGDGYPEIVGNVQLSGRAGLYVFRAGKDPVQAWKKTRIFDPGMLNGSRNRGLVHAAVSPRGIGDLDGDGDLDIAYLGSWVENADGRGTEWTVHENLGVTPSGKWGAAVRCWVADIDGDGHQDVVQSVCDAPGQPIVWLRNVNGDGSKWKTQTIPFEGTPGDMHSLVVADFDLDGDMDVYVDEMEHLHVPEGRSGKIGMIAFENLDGRGTKWKRTMLVTGIGGHQAQAADLDGDVDVDIVTRPYKARNALNGGRMHVSVLENLARSPDATGPGSKFNAPR